MSIDTVPKRTWKDLLHTGDKAALASIPIVGGAAAEMYGYFLVAPYTKRTEEFMKQFEPKLMELQYRQSFDLEAVMEREKVKTTFVQAYLIWLRNHQEAKREALLNAILNSMISDDADEDLEMIFLNIIDTITTSHMELLEFLRTNEIDLKGGNFPTTLDRKIYNAVNSVNTKFSDVGFFNLIIKDLIDKQLIDRMSKSKSEETYFGSVVTPMGERFLNYISLPK